MFKRVAILFVILLGVGLGVVALQPGRYEASQRRQLDAPAGPVFAVLSDFGSYDRWWWKPAEGRMATKIDGQPGAVGHRYQWKSSEGIEGELSLVEAAPPERLRLRLYFKRPYDSSADIEYALRPVGAGSEVSLTIRGDKSFNEKLLFMFYDMQQLMSEDLQLNLERLSGAVATQTSTAAGTRTASVARPVATP